MKFYLTKHNKWKYQPQIVVHRCVDIQTKFILSRLVSINPRATEFSTLFKYRNRMSWTFGIFSSAQTAEASSNYTDFQFAHFSISFC